MRYAKNVHSKKSTVFNSALKVILSLILVVAAIIAMFGNRIFSSDYISENYDNNINTSNFSNLTVKNNIDLANWAEMAYKNNWGYVYGTFGYVLSEQMLIDKSVQYPTDVGENEQFIRQNWLGRRTVDCMGLIKSYMWYDPQSNSITYNSGNMLDIGANTLFDESTVNGNIETIPEVKGLAVWAEGHIGIYIGNGYAIEAQSTHDGVKKTRISDRNWTHWFEIPQISYS